MRLWRWLVLILGVWQLSSTYALHFHSGFSMASSVIFGFFIALAGVIANLVPDRWPFATSGLFGLGLVALPFVHHTGAATDFVIVGALTCAASLMGYIERQHV
jgi:hypothetical protein